MQEDDKVKIPMVTWNVGRGASSQGSAKRRDSLIPPVLDYVDEHKILLLQESTIKTSTARARWLLSDNYEQQKERKQLYQGIDTTLPMKDMDLSKQIDKLVPKGKTDDKDALKRADKDAGFPKDIIVDDSSDRRLMRSDIPPRAIARKLEVVSHKGTKITVIVVSFHSVHNRSQKKRYIKLFFNLMCRLAQVRKCLVLVGGDFNLNVGDWKQDIERVFEDRVHVAEKYQPTPRRDRHNIIDTFAVVYPPGEKKVECTLSTPTAVYPFPDYVRRDDDDEFKVVRFTDQEKKDIKKLLPKNHHGDPNWKTLKYDLDHDPVLVKATLRIIH